MFEKFLNDDIDKEMMRDYLEQHAGYYDTLMQGIKTFSQQHLSSSDKYIDAISSQLLELNKLQQHDLSAEERIHLHNKSDELLDRMKNEADKNRNHAIQITAIAAGAFAAIGGGAIYLATRNPDLLKKGIETIAQETTKRIK